MREKRRDGAAGSLVTFLPKKVTRAAARNEGFRAQHKLDKIKRQKRPLTPNLSPQAGRGEITGKLIA